MRSEVELQTGSSFISTAGGVGLKNKPVVDATRARLEHFVGFIMIFELLNRLRGEPLAVFLENNDLEVKLAFQL